MTRPPMRCTHFAIDRSRCTTNATHHLLDSGRRRVPGHVYCEECALAVIHEYQEKLDWYWSMVPIEEENR